MGKSRYVRWSTHFLDALSLFDIDDYLWAENIELNSRGMKDIPGIDRIVKEKKIRIFVLLCPSLFLRRFFILSTRYSHQKSAGTI